MQTGFPGIEVVAVRTPTLPPATHTNAWVLGRKNITVVDPASPWEDEQARLFDALWARTTRGETLQRIFLTHHHHDHVAGALDLQHRFAEVGHQVPIAAHPATAALVEPAIPVQITVEDGEVLQCGGRSMVALHTPGHAPGHLALHDTESGAVIAGDLVAGVGTIAIDPREGDLQDYLDSLARVKELAPRALMPAHGPVLEHADAVLSFYIAHRHGRSEQIRTALGELGHASPLELTPVIYPELPSAHHALGAAQILTHLQWLDRNGLVEETPQGWRIK